MKDILYQYLVLYRQVALPGLGTIRLQRSPAQFDFAGKTFNPPVYSFAIDSGNDKPSPGLFHWLSSVLGISEWDAIKKVNDFSFEIKNHISSGNEFAWDRLGLLRRNETGSIVLDSDLPAPAGEQPVAAERVIRQHALHTIKVGEMEKTSAEMEELLVEKEKQRDWTWMAAIIITVLAVMMLGLYFSKKGLNPSATGNRAGIHAK